MAVASAYATAIRDGDEPTVEACQYPPGQHARLANAALLNNPDLILDDIASAAPGPIDQGSIVFSVPNPPSTRFPGVSDGRPLAQSGVRIALTQEPDGHWYVTGISGYAST